ncbi:MAG: hypothetical protein KAW49_15695, partial [Anaerolineae bacterium]|nr:hypothetical protein [Anaerolineae bacterium]
MAKTCGFPPYRDRALGPQKEGAGERGKAEDKRDDQENADESKLVQQRAPPRIDDERETAAIIA